MTKALLILILTVFLILDCKTFLMENIKNNKTSWKDIASIVLMLLAILFASIN